MLFFFLVIVVLIGYFFFVIDDKVINKLIYWGLENIGISSKGFMIEFWFFFLEIECVLFVVFRRIVCA